MRDSSYTYCDAMNTRDPMAARPASEPEPSAVYGSGEIGEIGRDPVSANPRRTSLPPPSYSTQRRLFATSACSMFELLANVAWVSVVPSQMKRRIFELLPAPEPSLYVTKMN